MTVSERHEESTRRLGRGELTHEGGGEARAVAQARYLRAVNRESPHVLRSLCDLAGWGGNDSEGERAIEADALAAWATRWNLSDSWCLDAARNTLSAWYGPTWQMIREESALDGRDWREALDWAYSAHVACDALDDDERALDLDVVAPWRDRHESRAAGKARMLAEFDAYLDGSTHPLTGETIIEGYLDRVERLARSRGLVTTPEKRSPDHFEWLAKYQIGRQRDGKPYSQSDLARHCFVSRQSVKEALDGTAALCGLTLRERGAAGRHKHGQARTIRVQSRPVATA